MFVKFYSAVALASLSAALNMNECRKADDFNEMVFAETKTFAAAQDGFSGYNRDGVTGVDPCIKIAAAWECNIAPEGCIFRDTAHECVKL